MADAASFPGQHPRAGTEGGVGTDVTADHPAGAGLAERYGRRPGGRSRLLRAVGALLLLAGVGYAGWYASTVAERPLTWQDTGFDPVGPGETTVSFRLTFNDDLPARAEAVCTVRALSDSSAEVGLRDVTVGPASRGTVEVTASVPTSELAVTGMVKGCALR